MQSEIMDISKIKLNPENPRIIKDDKFQKLVQSIKEFPEMLELRPIVVNTDMVILGGNMRYRALIEAGMKQVPVIVASGLTEEQQREFLIKDNVSGGDWDFDALLNSWDVESLDDWGLDGVNYGQWVSFEELAWVGADGVEVPDVDGKIFRWIQVPVKQEIYDDCFLEFKKLLNTTNDIWSLFYNFLKNENSRIG